VTTLGKTVPLPADDRRMTVPPFTLHECATYLHTPLSTLRAWARPKDGAPLVTVIPSAGRQATVPFVGFAEIAADFDVPSAEVEDVIRVALRLPA
jgi:Putative DNA-binding HTH domain